MMPRCATQSPDTKSPRPVRGPGRPAALSRRELAPITSPNGELTPQRRPHCACGGDWPSCQAKSRVIGDPTAHTEPTPPTPPHHTPHPPPHPPTLPPPTRPSSLPPT